MLSLLFAAALAGTPTQLSTPAVSVTTVEVEVDPWAPPPPPPLQLPEDGSRPTWASLPPNPRGQTDFTAYTLDWGEVRVGIGSVGIALFPGVQLSTQPLLDAVRMPNVALKMDLLQLGDRFDGAVNGSLGHMRTDTLNALYVTAGGTASVIVTPAWSLHGGAQWTYAAAIGEPDLAATAEVVEPLVGNLPSDASLQYLSERLAYEVRIEAVTLRAATDFRINRRDSIILQGQAVLWAWTRYPNYAERFVSEESGFVPITDTYTASLAWQFSWRNVDLRVGGGISSVPGAWLLNTVDLAWRFGGKTRGHQAKRLQAWRGSNKVAAATRPEDVATAKLLSTPST
ncbi:MAG: hypothetical protein Q8P18_18720 [Pseudomonadota bacterium]|nr:hypothetical protein [Pseudomonadota bacterium]